MEWNWKYSNFGGKVLDGCVFLLWQSMIDDDPYPNPK